MFTELTSPYLALALHACLKSGLCLAFSVRSKPTTSRTSQIALFPNMVLSLHPCDLWFRDHRSDRCHSSTASTSSHRYACLKAAKLPVPLLCFVLEHYLVTVAFESFSS